MFPIPQSLNTLMIHTYNDLYNHIILTINFNSSISDFNQVIYNINNSGDHVCQVYPDICLFSKMDKIRKGILNHSISFSFEFFRKTYI